MERFNNADNIRPEQRAVEEELAIVKRRLAEAEQIARLGDWEFNCVTGEVYWSDEMFEISGMPRSQFTPTYERYFQFIHPDDLPQYKAKIEEFIREKNELRIEYRLVRPDGTIVNIWMIATIERNADDKPLKVRGIAQDITERKAAEEALKESEDKFSKAFHANPEIMAISTLDDGRYIDVNESFINVIGYSQEEAIGHTGIELGIYVNPEDRLQIIEELKTDLHIRNKEIEIQRRSGEIRDMLFSAEVIEFGGRRCMLSMVSDITDRKHTEQELRRYGKRITDILESITDAFMALDRDWSVTYMNSEAEKLLKFSREELIGKVLWDAFPEDVSKVIYPKYTQALENQVSIIFDDYFPAFSAWFEVHVYPSESGLSIYFQDISERKRVEMDKEKARSVLQEVYERERRIAETLQRNFLPDKRLEIPGYRLADAYYPALDEAAIGGDVYDMFTMSGNKVGFVIADVSGKGLKAARHGAMVKYMLRAYSCECDDPSDVLAKLNNAIIAHIDIYSFVTCFFGVLDLNTHVLSYANGGHDEPMHIPGCKHYPERLRVTGSALGIERNTTYDLAHLKLRPRDMLLLYTDGVTDARGMEDRLCVEGLEKFLADHCNLSADVLVEQLVTEVKRRSGNRLADDVAIVALEVTDSQSPSDHH